MLFTAFQDWLQRRFTSAGRLASRKRRAPARFRPAVEILERRTLPSFAPAVSYPVGAGPQSVVVADFNRDGIADIATANYGDNSVSVLLGKAGGGFDPAVFYSVGVNSGPVSLAVTDFNRDGVPDLVTANLLSNSVSVLQGQTSGGFDPAVSYSVGHDPANVPFLPESVAVGDLNGDGIPDIVTADELSEGYQISNYVSVLYGKAGGGFEAAVTYQGGDLPQSVSRPRPPPSYADPRRIGSALRCRRLDRHRQKWPTTQAVIVGRAHFCFNRPSPGKVETGEPS